MRYTMIATTLAAGLGLFAGPLLAHDHAHHDDPVAEQVYNGYFEDSQIAARPLSDWAGEWQSVYPYLQDGTLDPVMAHKAESGEQSAEEYRAYYETGYQTETVRLDIAEDGNITFHETDGTSQRGLYVSDGYEVLTYEKGNRGVRFIFKKETGDEMAPDYIQFSDHRISPSVADHYHLYWGDDRAALLEEVTHWPTYYPAALTGQEILDEMLAH